MTDKGEEKKKKKKISQFKYAGGQLSITFLDEAVTIAALYFLFQMFW